MRTAERHGTGLRTILSGLLLWLAAVACGVVAAAPTTGTAYSDLWWNPAESGWGVTVDHQERFVFLTFFIYKAGGTPYWVVASLDQVGSPNLDKDPVAFTGPVYEVSGPYFGGAFDPAKVTERQVGTATFTANSLYSASLVYSINDVSVTKALQRQTLAPVDFSGNYVGSVAFGITNCANSPYNNQVLYDHGFITVRHNPSVLSIEAKLQTLQCTFNGNYVQAGSLAGSAGSFVCSDGSTGTFGLNALQRTVMGITAYFSAVYQGCSFGGPIGGLLTSRE